ncbi:Dihydroxy-acid dehydratase [Sulfitobacter noctilucicola]|uniref:Uncharacterized protein n=1 Tax=Sulfitobacter noctilucicola TaxID=1342301 RepID=A0A7W6Q475_9RHOB|nr:hypothetical protein [Sulfitobacter noctilucicola]KIN63068.1 Dihydroxy-acid dehydratase [Sulfitobacter noctilucicola]MBB4172405.1 hypothetical protein [Sulfitobacter noctilucicola]
MITWSSKAAGATLAVGLLAGCEGGDLGALLPSSQDSGKVALSQARMAFGSVMLRPPSGFCIDKSSLKQNFALMARCDALGAPSAASDAPRGLISVSFSKALETLPTAVQTAEALSLTGVSDTRIQDGHVTFRATGTTPADGLSAVHWRGIVKVNDQVMGIALFAPEGARATGSSGRALLLEIIAGTTAGF